LKCDKFGDTKLQEHTVTHHNRAAYQHRQTALRFNFYGIP